MLDFDLRGFQFGVAVGGRPACLTISAAADLLGFSIITVSRIYREGAKKSKNSLGILLISEVRRK